MNEAAEAGLVRARVLSFPVATLRVARVAPFRVLRGRRVLALALLGLAPVMITVLLRSLDTTMTLGVRGFVDFLMMFTFGVALPVSMLFVGAAAIGDDIDNGTLLYLRLRPIPRGAIVCGRYIASCLSGLVLLLPCVLLLYVAQVSARGAGSLGEHLDLLLAAGGCVVLGALVYGAFFLLLSLLVRHAVIIGMLALLVWDFGVSVVPAYSARATVSFHLSALLSKVTDEGPVLVKRMHAFQDTGIIPAARSSVVGMLVAALVLVAAACLVFRNREYHERPGDV